MTNEKRETAIKWLQNEIRSLRLAPTINGCGPENWADLLEIMETCLEAVKGCFVDTNKMSPLTLNQLREMLENDGEIIGAAVIVSEDGVLSHAVLDSRVEDGICASTGASGEWLKEKDYGKTWLAYTYRLAATDTNVGGKDSNVPTSIDREEWKKCPWCKSEYTVIDDDFGQPVHPKMIKFCWKCGRPLTPEAWAMLEKRLRRW